MSKQNRKLFVEVLEIILICLALSWFAKSYILGFTQVKEKGMYPTLGLNNQLVVAKLFYTDIHHLERGDVIVYISSDHPASHVKRLIGLPGDQVEIRNGYTYINGEPIYEPYTENPITYQFKPVIVPSEHVFVLNDNRYEHNDSRTRGSVPIENLKGKAILSFWPITRARFI